MKEVLLKSDVIELLRKEKKYWSEQWVCSELYRGGATDAIDRLLMQLYTKSSNLKASDKPN